MSDSIKIPLSDEIVQHIYDEYVSIIDDSVPPLPFEEKIYIRRRAD